MTDRIVDLRKILSHFESHVSFTLPQSRAVHSQLIKNQKQYIIHFNKSSIYINSNSMSALKNILRRQSSPE